MSLIRVLPPTTVNRIAAGEVVERPASVIKELVENALDAGASQVEIATEVGGKRLLSVRDNGMGMGREDILLAVMRHATSKLPDDDLLHIRAFGFRGEALPSIGSISRMRITSKAKDSDEAWELLVEGGHQHEIQPASHNQGTTIEVRDIFYATPARLKFMKGDIAETQAIVDIVQRLAMANPHVGFVLRCDGNLKVNYTPESGDKYQATLQRLSRVLGKNFAENALVLGSEREQVGLYGFAGLPTYHRATSAQQYLFVNGRAVRDKLLLGTVRAAYQDYLARDRHPVVVLYLEVPAEMVDVNVHPAKAEVRFRDNAMIRGLIIGTLRHTLQEAGHRASTTVSQATLGAVRNMTAAAPTYQAYARQDVSQVVKQDMMSFQEPLSPVFQARSFSEAPAVALWGAQAPSPMMRTEMPQVAPDDVSHPLGAACGQLHKTYIVAQTKDGMVIVDQHAAHERLVYEQMKLAMESKGHVPRQALLIPEVITLDEGESEVLLQHAETLAELGLMIESFGDRTLVVREVPAMIASFDVVGMVRDLADEVKEYGEALGLKEKLASIAGNHACRHSVRAGRTLTVHEMNALLRQMEQTPHSGQCNHGRPTYVELKLQDIERLFGRK